MELAGAIYLIGAIVAFGATLISGALRGLQLWYGAALLTLLTFGWPVFLVLGAVDMVTDIREERREKRKAGDT